VVKIIADKDGKTLEEPVIVDLTDRTEGSGRYRRTIVESVPPTQYFEEMQSFADLL
jgi:hypothetical protein